MRVLFALAAFAATTEAQKTNTSLPWGLKSTDTTGQCEFGDCANTFSCYDLANLDGLDRDETSINLFSTDEDDDGQLQALMEDGERYDFYQTLERFACCDCTDCMRYDDCLVQLVDAPAGITCAAIWEFLLPTVHTEEQLMDALDTLNAGGCYWCYDLQNSLDGSDVSTAADYQFEMPSETTTTTSTTFRTSTTESYDTCADLGCGNVGEVCSCEVSCAREYSNGESDKPCCADYDDEGCEPMCVDESYQVGNEEDMENEVYSCDDIIDLFHLSDDEQRFTCEDLESLFGLNCNGCMCEYALHPSPAPIPECANEDANCGFGWVAPMSCDSLIAASRETLTAFPDQMQSHLTCASLEELDCDCTGCQCERDAECAGRVEYDDTGETEILCMGGYSCDYWVDNLPGVTCEMLEDDYGCNCNYCECERVIPDSTPEPECRCEVEYVLGALDGSDSMQNVTCDILSEASEGLCCGVMEYAFQMDCSGCCCDVQTCDTCVENTTTTTTTSTTTTEPECPANDDEYDECTYDVTCLDEDSFIPQTTQYNKQYDCNWIATYIENDGEDVCFQAGGLPCTTDANCPGSLVCDDLVCSVCADPIPGAAVESDTEEPCYYPNHPGNPLYTAYDCVDDEENGDGCIYFELYRNRTDYDTSYCQIELNSVNCPNEPPECVDPVCEAQWIPQTTCSASCGGGQRTTEYSCFAFQDGVDCGYVDEDTIPTNCVSPGISTVGSTNISPCNTNPCDVQVCDEDLVGDGFCDWTVDMDRATFLGDTDAEAVNNNLEFCNWDGGDCCTYSCEHDDTTESVTFGGLDRGSICSWAGGGCQTVSEADKDRAISESAFFNPNNGLGSSPGVLCSEISTDVWDCCQEAVLFNGADSSDGACVYGTVTFSDCAVQSGRCLDPNAPKLVSSSSPEPTTTTTL